MHDVQSETASAARKKRPADMRTVHRVLSFLACLLMLYMGVTGTLIQSIDLGKLLTGTPESDATMQSINEGKFGGSAYSITSVSDWSGAPLPENVDVAKGIATTLAAFHAAEPKFEPMMVELRMVEGRVVGQVGFKDPAMVPPKRRERRASLAVRAYDVETGAAVSPADITPAMPPRSTRQALKEWHRFWKDSDKPGVYAEFLTGLVMSTLIFTGIVMYFRLLRQRRKMKRAELFWSAGGMLKTLHRGVSTVAAILLVMVAASGTWLGFESSWNTFSKRTPPPKPQTLTDEQGVRLTAAAYKLFRTAEPETPVRTVRARLYAGNEEAGIVTGTSFTRQKIYDIPSGKEMTLNEPQYPKNGFPLGLNVHEWVKHFHSGYLFGLPARFLDLLAGLSLIFLSVSGLWMYIDMYRQRARTGRKALFWK
ncbi:PepSY domain-containing protein [Novosphingobium flavum]|uniref:PepSY domain-containing protein n=1 Tax=Novosphingobium flavum TaxID=1778672 RepID=A0A7X1KMH8_9SPHN|nr:PepSY-associated TM helix domain-containing protein [Novosphingobium flavum]MBC2666315.1 PepSY domain-containing protein [Novosphingobium flavum]